MTYKLEAGAALDSSYSFGPTLIDGGPIVNLSYPYLVVSTIDGGFFTDGAGIQFDAGALPLVGKGTFDPNKVYTDADIIIPYVPPPPPPPPPITKPTITVTIEQYAHPNTVKTLTWTTTNTNYVTIDVVDNNQTANGSATFTAPGTIGPQSVSLTAYNTVTGETTTFTALYSVIGPPTVKLRVSPTGVNIGDRITIFWESANSTYVTTNITTGPQLPSGSITIRAESVGFRTITATATSSLSNNTDVVVSPIATTTYTVA